MPKISIYLPDSLYAEIRGGDIPVSAVAQRALEDAVRTRRNTEWIARARGRKARATAPVDTSALMDQVREEFGA
ncbi:MAG: type II toxin-antitoxin system CcdA family antitoxin [Bifidobacteriaceae bacterium]|jgi:post-segregation antitoxin (ccd killing protein)|nr:type II toxin-antitoxin system CcdA family antitoxin [Bifidobacteriaceae bacterium]